MAQVSPRSSNRSTMSSQKSGEKKCNGLHDFTIYILEKTSKRPTKSELDKYLEDVLDMYRRSKF